MQASVQSTDISPWQEVSLHWLLQRKGTCYIKSEAKGDCGCQLQSLFSRRACSVLPPEARVREFSGKAPPVLLLTVWCSFFSRAAPRAVTVCLSTKSAWPLESRTGNTASAKGKSSPWWHSHLLQPQVGPLTSSSAPPMRHLPSLLWKLNRLGSHSTQTLPRSQPPVCGQVRQILWLGGIYLSFWEHLGKDPGFFFL